MALMDLLVIAKRPSGFLLARLTHDLLVIYILRHLTILINIQYSMSYDPVSAKT